MKCPRTGTDLKEIEIDGVKIDISESCGGVWFDNFELEKFDNVDKAAGPSWSSYLLSTRTKSWTSSLGFRVLVILKLR